MIKAVSTPNIALIKYWGNRDERLRLPAADSLSMTLDAPSVEVSMEEAGLFSLSSFEADGSEKKLNAEQIERCATHLKLMDIELGRLGHAVTRNSVKIVIRSHIPAGIGLASSAAVFSAIAKAYSAIRAPSLADADVSGLARLGSGSAARSIFGGFAALWTKTGNAEQIADEKHWRLHDVVLVPSATHKKVGSTEGHASAHTSPLFEDRLKEIPRRMEECMNAISRKDFEKLQRVSEEDALDMHAVMRAQTPSLDYLNDDTHRILKEIESLRTSEHLEVLYTMDAGPTVHLICTDAALSRIKAYAETQKACTVFTTSIGNGSRLI